MNEIKVKISKEPDIKVYIDGTRGDVVSGVYAPAIHTHPISDIIDLQNELDDKSDVGHEHIATDITDFNSSVFDLITIGITEHTDELDPHEQYLTEDEADALYSPLGHNHDDRYYTEDETDTLLDSKSDTTHNHDDSYSPLGHIHDDRYYTETEVDTLLESKSDILHGHIIDDVINLQTELDGKASISHTHTYSLDNLSDVTVITPVADQVLKYNGTNWVNDTVPAGATDLNGLTDVVLTSIQPNDIIVYNGTEWINETRNIGLNTIIYVILTSPVDGQYLAFDGFNWRNVDLPVVVEDAIVNGVIDKAPSQNAVYDALANKSDVGHTHSLDNLSDVIVTTPTLDQVLKYDGTNWINADAPDVGDPEVSYQEVFISTASQTVFTLANSATGISIVSVNGIQQNPSIDYTLVGDILTFAVGLNLSDELVVSYGVNLSSLSLIDDAIVNGVTDKAPSQNAVYDALADKSDVGHTHIATDTTDFNSSVFDLITIGLTEHTDEPNPHPQYLTETEADALYSPLGHNHDDRYYTETEINDLLDDKSDTSHTHTLDGLSDVVITSPVTDQILKFDGTNWVNDEDAGSSSTLDGLTDVVITSPVTDQILKFDGTNWINAENEGGGGSSTNVLGEDFSDSNIVKIKPLFGSNSVHTEGLTFTTGAMISKHYITALASNYSVVDTAYKRIGGSLIGSGDSNSTTSYIYGTIFGITTGNAGYKFHLLGGIDKITNIPDSICFMGMLGCQTGDGGSGINDLYVATTSFDSVDFGLIGFGWEPGDDNLQIITKRHNTTTLKIDLGSSFPIEQYSHYRMELVKDSASSTTVAIITNLISSVSSTTTVVDNGITSYLPVNTEAVSPAFMISANTSSAHNISFVRCALLCGYTES